MHFGRDATVVVNDAQFDWTRWMAGAANAPRAARLGNALPIDLRRRRPPETSVLRLLGSCAFSRQVDYCVNAASPNGRSIALPQAESIFVNPKPPGEGFRTHRNEDLASVYNPLPRDVTRRLIDDAFMRLKGTAESRRATSTD